MKKVIIQSALILSLLLIQFISYSQDIKFDLSDQEKIEILKRIDGIAENDQKFREYMSVGSLDATILNEADSILQNQGPEEYFKYLTVKELELPEEVLRSLNILQSHLDSINLIEVVDIIKTYGYPSKERLGVKGDRFYPVFLHPHRGLDIKVYQETIFNLLLPEVKAQRMEAKMLATFYDNMNAKILGTSQLYGTNKKINRETFQILPPVIADIKLTNEARKELGLDPLKEGEYTLEKESH